MQSKPKYKVCKRLGSGVYDKCQSPKYTQSEARSAKNRTRRRGRRGGSQFGTQLIEKQRVKTMYGVSERQFARYVKDAFSDDGGKPQAVLYRELESRLDNVVYRSGLAATRRAARQLVSHGHFTVNGTKVRIPSYRVKKGDVIAVRDGSKDKPVFQAEREDRKTPAWVTYKSGEKELSISGSPVLADSFIFDLSQVLEFYSR